MKTERSSTARSTVRKRDVRVRTRRTATQVGASVLAHPVSLLLNCVSVVSTPPGDELSENMPVLQAPRATNSVPEITPAPASAPAHAPDAACIVTAVVPKAAEPRRVGIIESACVEGLSFLGYFAPPQVAHPSPSQWFGSF